MEGLPTGRKGDRTSCFLQIGEYKCYLDTQLDCGNSCLLRLVHVHADNSLAQELILILIRMKKRKYLNVVGETNL
jgi:hypothetical protein